MRKRKDTIIEEPQSFVIRMWREGLGQWRGKISHVQSQESRAFTRLEESHRFMAAHLPQVEIASRNRAAQVRDFSLFPRLPRSRPFRLAAAAVSVCILAFVAILVYPADSPESGMIGAAAGSGLGTVLAFLLGAVLGGAVVGVWVRTAQKKKGRSAQVGG